MAWQRIGLVPDTDHEDAQHLHRSALVISRKASSLGNRYGRAVLGTLEQPAGNMRLVSVGAIVIWGSDDMLIGRMMIQNQAAMIVVVLRAKPKKDSDVMRAAIRLSDSGLNVEIYSISAKAKDVRGVDVGSGPVVRDVLDLQRPPQQQSAPSTPRRKVEARTHSAPRVPSKSTPAKRPVTVKTTSTSAPKG